MLACPRHAVEWLVRARVVERRPWRWRRLHRQGAGGADGGGCGGGRLPVAHHRAGERTAGAPGTGARFRDRGRGAGGGRGVGRQSGGPGRAGAPRRAHGLRCHSRRRLVLRLVAEPGPPRERDDQLGHDHVLRRRADAGAAGDADVPGRRHDGTAGRHRRVRVPAGMAGGFQRAAPRYRRGDTGASGGLADHRDVPAASSYGHSLVGTPDSLAHITFETSAPSSPPATAPVVHAGRQRAAAARRTADPAGIHHRAEGASPFHQGARPCARGGAVRARLHARSRRATPKSRRPRCGSAGRCPPTSAPAAISRRWSPTSPRSAPSASSAKPIATSRPCGRASSRRRRQPVLRARDAERKGRTPPRPRAPSSITCRAASGS